MPRVLLLGDEFHATLAAVRGLSAASFEIVLGVSRPQTYASRSRHVRDVVLLPDPDRDPDAFADRVAEAAAGRRADVVLPGTESALVVLNDRRDRLPELVTAALPAADVVALAVDKSRVLALAEPSGLAVVPTAVGDADELAARRGSFEYPVVLKPLRSKLPVGGGELRYFRAGCYDDAEALGRALAGLPGEWCVQPYIPSRLAAVAGVARGGEVLTAVHQRSERIWPPAAGYSSSAVTVEPDEGLERGVRELVRRVGWTGIFQAQFLDADDESTYLIDFNPRPYGSLALAQAAGADLVGTWARIALGDEAMGSGYRVGVRFRLEHNDARAILRLARGGDLRGAARALRPRRRTAHGIVSLSDPGPLLVAAGKLVRLASRRR